MTDDVLAKQPAVFVCIWWRALLAHHGRQLQAQDSEGIAEVPEVAQYLQRAWDTGRDESGLFTQVSRYDECIVLDHASVTGLMAAYAARPECWPSLL